MLDHVMRRARAAGITSITRHEQTHASSRP